MSANDHPTRMGALVRARREELGLTQDEVSAAGGPSNTTLTVIEQGRGRFSPVTLRRLDQGLKWAPGSAKRALAGGDPAPLSVAAAETVGPQSDDELGYVAAPGARVETDAVSNQQVLDAINAMRGDIRTMLERLADR